MALEFPSTPSDRQSFTASNGVIYQWSAEKRVWRVRGSSQLVETPPGVMWDFAGMDVPEGWYLCDGALKSRLLDAPLFNAIGTLYGDGNGDDDDDEDHDTMFALPDLRGRVTAMVDDGSGRLPTVADELGATGGAAMIALTQAEMPAHGHPATGAGQVGNNLVNGTGRAVGTADGVNSGPFQEVQVTVHGTGGNGAHNNTQPTMVVNKIIKR